MNNLAIEYRVMSAFETNVYFLVNRQTNEMILVDPSENPDYIVDQADRRGYQPAAILLTHGHVDHIGALAGVRAAWPGVKVYAYEGERQLLADPWMNRSQLWAEEPIRAEADVWLKDGEILHLAGFKIEVIHTPGHTSGSCVYYLEDEKVLISGDTLFRESYGRVDLPTGSEAAIFRSVQMLVERLPEDVEVYPGHMEPTTIGHEKKYNPAVP